MRIRILKGTKALPGSQSNFCGGLFHSNISGPKYTELYAAIRHHLKFINPNNSLDKVCFCWAPSHCNITVNEAADRLAFEGAMKAQNLLKIPRVFGFPIKPVFSKINSLANTAVQIRWSNISHARTLYQIKPNFSTNYIDKLNPFISTVIYKLSTGVCGLKYHHSWQLKDPNQDLSCPNCNHSPEKTTHFLLNCPAYDN